MRFNTVTTAVEPVTNLHKDDIKLVLTENLPVLELLSSVVSVEKEANTIIQRSDLPPGVTADQLLAYLLSDARSNCPIGVLTCLAGYPASNTFYIGLLFLRPAWQFKGIGRDIVEQIHAQLSSAGYAESRVLVGLKNWPALRFWTNMGYCTVSNFKGDSAFSDNHYCSIELSRIVP